MKRPDEDSLEEPERKGTVSVLTRSNAVQVDLFVSFRG